MKFWFLFLSIIGVFLSNAQTTSYWVSFTDKEASEYSLQDPASFLSINVIERREHFNLPIEATDLPVCSAYINGVRSFDAVLAHASSWLNGAIFTSENPLFMEQVAQLPYVAEVKDLSVQNKRENLTNKLAFESKALTSSLPELDYGFGDKQIKMIGGDRLHQMGLKGEGMDIAIMDNGFNNVDTNPYFRKALSEGRIVEMYNFVDDTDVLFANGDHGSSVISTILSDSAGALIGVAPEATIYLFTTEDDAAEGLQEEINWALAAEMAEDSLGLRVVLSTSLGYSTGFDNAADEHSYSEMDGNTTIITKAADLAARKGLLVVNSAGNEGNSNWRYVTAPADGDSVLAVGAVFSNRLFTIFSSKGPSFDGRVKPNVMAQGGRTVGVDPDNFNLVEINGTSFSCPITSGMAACLWQHFPNRTNMEVLSAIEKSADMYHTPNDDYGYGIPNFYLAFKLLETEANNNETEEFLVWPNPADAEVFLLFLEPEDMAYEMAIYSLAGERLVTSEGVAAALNSVDVSALPKGTYIVRVKKGKKRLETKFVKL